jgi:hypothetical protein
MKRLSVCERKTPVDKENKCPDFYELAKTSPLPELLSRNGTSTTASTEQEPMQVVQAPQVAASSVAVVPPTVQASSSQPDMSFSIDNQAAAALLSSLQSSMPTKQPSTEESGKSPPAVALSTEESDVSIPPSVAQLVGEKVIEMVKNGNGTVPTAAAPASLSTSKDSLLSNQQTSILINLIRQQYIQFSHFQTMMPNTSQDNISSEQVLALLQSKHQPFQQQLQVPSMGNKSDVVAQLLLQSQGSLVPNVRMNLMFQPASSTSFLQLDMSQMKAFPPSPSKNTNEDAMTQQIRFMESNTNVQQKQPQTVKSNGPYQEEIMMHLVRSMQQQQPVPTPVAALSVSNLTNAMNNANTIQSMSQIYQRNTANSQSMCLVCQLTKQERCLHQSM